MTVTGEQIKELVDNILNIESVLQWHTGHLEELKNPNPKLRGVNRGLDPKR